MTALQTLAAIAVAVAAISIAILMLDDVLAELDRRRREEEIWARARRQMRQRHS